MTTRSTTTRVPRDNSAEHKRHRAQIRRTRPPCGICGQPIDYSLHYLQPMAYVVDHIIPLAKGGADTLDNKQAAHRACNRTKSDKLPGDDAPRTYVTSRQWWTPGG